MTGPSLANYEATSVESNADLRKGLAALTSNQRNDIDALPLGALAYLLSSVSRDPDAKFIIVCPTLEVCDRLASDLRFFHQDTPILRFPPPDTTPFVDVVPDRSAEMQRLASLSHIAEGSPWRFLLTPVTGAIRKVPPIETLRARTLRIAVGDTINREHTIARIAELGYLRVPLAEDAGTFSVRGAVIDVFPPADESPVRIELDDREVISIRLYDPDSQKTTSHTNVHTVRPAREVPDEADAIQRAKSALRELCDQHNVPTIQAKELSEELNRGSGALVSTALLPAYYDRMSDIFGFAEDATVVWLDPTHLRTEAVAERERAVRDRAAKLATSVPRFDVDRHYMTLESTDKIARRRKTLVAHKLAVMGASAAPEEPLPALTTATAPLRFDAADHALITNALRTANQHGGLGPIVTAVKTWVDQGLRVGFVARTRPQADRLASVFRHHNVQASIVADGTPADLVACAPGSVRIVLGDLRDGFVWWSEGIVWMAEEEIFGNRVRRAKRKKTTKRQQQRFIEDLRELAVGDFVVHADHGVGKYLGLHRKSLGQSAQERMFGAQPKSVEVMLLEYAGGDRLFLPVTRLGVIQKFKGKEGHQPKLDRLGGSTFATKKRRVREAVRQMAEELLKLYAERAAAERPSLGAADSSYAEFEASFPFEETRDQARAIDEVLSDLEGDKPMDRLVCGDVGFGKTEVAMRATFRAAMDGRQVAVLCPTTVLAQQHFRTFRDRLEHYPIEVRSLSRFVSKKDQQESLRGLRQGNVDVVIGTHRLLSRDVHFKNLGLLIVDEEQRFGVAHKERIKKLRARVDVLTLSATPIPRTLQLAIGGLRDLSLIATAPVDRRAVRTFVCRWDDHLIKEAIEREISRGGQVFFVYNRIEGLYERAQRLQQLVPQGRFAVAHGRMKAADLERAMADFVDGEYDVLCSTAIVESGLDIPRANTILIDRADTLGLAQLYQLKGRVGRSSQRAYCYLITPAPSEMSEESRTRMEALERFSGLGAGFHVAALDMEQRGAGDLLGAEQSGTASLVGFDMFVRMLTEAVAELRGDPVADDMDPEMTVDVEHYLPDDYIDDVGLRLSLYRRFATAQSEEAVDDLSTEMTQRFGPAPAAANEFVRVMSLKPALRWLRALGCEASSKRVTFHLKQDTPLDPTVVMPLVSEVGSGWTLSPDMKLTRRFDDEGPDAVTRIQDALRQLRALVREGAPNPESS